MKVKKLKRRKIDKYKESLIFDCSSLISLINIIILLIIIDLNLINSDNDFMYKARRKSNNNHNINNKIQQQEYQNSFTRHKRWIQQESLPDFIEPIGNLSVAMGREAQLSCKTKNLGQNHRTAWLRVEDRDILSIHDSIITRNYRVAVRNDDGNFVLTIKNVQPSDKGGYMCQINSVPMKSVIGYLDVLTPPTFEPENNIQQAATTTTSSTADNPSSPSQSNPPGSLLDSSSLGGALVSAIEGSNASLTCRARGHPKPSISWRREDNEPIQLNGAIDSTTSPQEIGDSLQFNKVTRANSGAYLCIASNGVPPAASKRQILNVQYGPIVRVPQTEVGAYLQDTLAGSGGLSQSSSRAYPSSIARLVCNVEINPIGSYYWTKLPGGGGISTPDSVADDSTLIELEQLSNSDKYEIVIKQVDMEQVEMILDIRQPTRSDLSWYKCIAKNFLGTRSGAIRLYEASPSSYSFNGIIRAQQQQQQQQQQLNEDSKLGLSNLNSNGRAQNVRSNGNYRSVHHNSHSPSIGRQASESNSPSVSSSSSAASYTDSQWLKLIIMPLCLLNLISNAFISLQARLSVYQEKIH